ncbi:MAG: PQQ-dependent sugar dehydrogenase, partial [Gemmatimonadetes bacterium]|nr:PQQ-dependent sugar dehydrogenase [Gemmatimonadota bacterium]
MRRGAVGALCVALTLVTGACDRPPTLPTAEAMGVSDFDATLPRCPSPAPLHVSVDTLARGLEAPWDLAFLPDGSALLTERPGRIRRVGADGSVDPEPWAEIGPLAGDEVGLMGIDVAEAADGAWTVYVAAAIDLTGPPGPMRRVRGLGRRMARLFDRFAGAPRRLDVLAFPAPEGPDPAPAPTRIVSVVPLGTIHGGGGLAVGPDGLLYLSNGDGMVPPEAQDPRSPRGTVLRYSPAGDPAPLRPEDPIPAVLEGLRNSQAFAWHPASDHMLVLDHGPSGLPVDGGRVGNDELNVAHLGDNLGWPVVAGLSEGGPYRSPTVEWTSAIAPGGLAVAPDPRAEGAWAAYVTGLRDGVLRRLPLDPSNLSRIPCEEPILDRGYGRLRLVASAPDGSLWVGTSNRDGRGGPRPGDDLLLRVQVVASPA